MRSTKLTAFTVILFATFIIASCDREDIEFETLYIGSDLPVNGAQEVPAVTTSGTGLINASYSKLNKTLTYKVTWSGLTGQVNAAHIHGTAEKGYIAGVIQGFTGFPNPALYGVSGTYSGTVFMDGIIFKEADLLADKYYINLHTAFKPGGEIRGQLILRN